MRTAKTLFLSMAPLMVTESLPLILVTAVYELDIIRYLFLGHPTRPVSPSRRKLDYIGFLPIPDKAKSWQGSLVAVLCGLVWFFSEFTLDIVLIILGVNIADDLKKQIQPHEQQLRYDDHDDIAVVEDLHEGVKAKSMHNHQHHRDIYDNSEEYFGDHQPQQQQHGGRRWTRKFRGDNDSAYGYDASEEGDDVVEQSDLQDESLVWNMMERSVEYEEEGDFLFEVSAAFNRDLTLGTDVDEEEGKAVLSRSIAPPAAGVEGERVMGLQEKIDGQSSPMSEIRLLPAAAQDFEHIVYVLSDPDTDADADADVDTEAADEPKSAPSSLLSSTSTSCTDLHSETEMKGSQGQAHSKDDFTDDTKAWIQLSASTKTAEAPTLDDCRMTSFIHQHGGDEESVESVHEYPAEQSQDQWSEWAKLFWSTQEQHQQQGRIVTSPSSRRHIALFPRGPLAAESTAESLSDNDRIRDEKRKALKYAKKKKAAKAKKASSLLRGGE
ncbi:hypothetical protein BGZ96_001462 [Linnemannia gamsii]|uniref:Uncharacterized protein n=1 Tax=Linnemannia gamsii TaxID=64522 RepID=A0ABQ7JMC4_9FUNG|nr:hypothetical protein BGZ96_001462 [Linnemannia gamsii]